MTEQALTVLVVHPSGELYGSDRVMLESVSAMTARGWTVRVALAADGPLRAAAESTGAIVDITPSPVLRKAALSPRGLLGLAGDVVRSFPAMMRLCRRTAPDVVYVSTVTIPLWSVVARLRRIPVVCHVHEAEAAAHPLVRRALAAPLLLARRVLANSQTSRDVLLQDLELLGERTYVVYNGVPGPPTPSPPRDSLTGPIRLGLVGRISPRKGTDVAVEALGLLVERGLDATLDLVGGVFPGYEWFDDEVNDTAGRVGVADRIHRLGILPDVWAAYSEVDIALVPSRVEPFGNAAVEAMLACRPVVVGDVQGLREIVSSREFGERARPGDAESLAAAVERTVQDWKSVRDRTHTVRAEAERRFSTQRYHSELLHHLGAARRPTYDRLALEL